MKQSEVPAEQRQKMILELARTFGLTTVSHYDHIPENLKILFSNFHYCVIVTPLVKIDRKENELRIRQLVNKYFLSRGTITRILNKPNYDRKKLFVDLSSSSIAG